MPDPTFEDLLEFPARMTLRVMGVASPDLRERCLQRAERVSGRAVEAVESKASSKGNYVVHRLTLTSDSADQLRAVYEGLRSLDGVRLVL